MSQDINKLSLIPDYWDFRRGARRDALHGISQYPAMMVPAMQAKLLDIVSGAMGKKIRMVDPFIGSGTMLVEATRRGIDFAGQDINPLAILISLSKSGPLDATAFMQGAANVLRKAKNDRKSSIAVNFPGREKWFQPTISRDLSKLRRAIQEEEHIWVRQMLWVALAETIRITSNSRTSTFKLHIRTTDDLESRRKKPISIFELLTNGILFRIQQEIKLLTESKLLKKGVYIGNVDIKLGSSDTSLPGDEPYDLLMTSPPYGDGATTVPYGQYSYLPLQWIDLADISPNIEPNYLNSTHEIDSRALGGLCRNALERSETAMEQSQALKKYLESIRKIKKERLTKVASFFADFSSVLDTACARMRKDGYMIWTVGNRRVGGIVQPLDEILSELLSHRGCLMIKKIERAIPSKRMASRNSVSQTMRQEQVLILRAGKK